MPGFTVTCPMPRFWNVTFDNPPVNLVDPEMILELQCLVDQLEHDPVVAVVVFESSNRDHFRGPYDMSRVATRPRPQGRPGCTRGSISPCA